MDDRQRYLDGVAKKAKGFGLDDIPRCPSCGEIGGGYEFSVGLSQVPAGGPAVEMVLDGEKVIQIACCGATSVVFYHPRVNPHAFGPRRLPASGSPQ